MNYEVLPNLINFIEVVILIYTIIRAVTMVKSGKRYVPVIYFFMGAMALTLDLFYWLAYYVIMPPDIRMPFTADFIAENAGYLLLATAVKTSFDGKLKLLTKESAGAIIFIICNILLWIWWSGEVLQDILGGIAFGYLFCVVTNALKQSEVFNGKLRAMMIATAFTLVAVAGLPFFLPEMKQLSEWIYYSIIFISVIFYMCCAFRMQRSGSPGIASVSFTAFCWTWCSVCMYMSSEPMYYLPDIMAVISLLFMMLAFRKTLNGSGGPMPGKALAETDGPEGGKAVSRT